MMTTTEFYTALRAGDEPAVRAALAAEPALVWQRNPDPEQWDQCSPLHCATKHGHLALVKLLVEAGAEVYSHPFNTYPAVSVAAWERHQAILDYFLNDIPDRADGTRGVGITLNLAGRHGLVEQVKRHLALDPLAVHQRGWIGDTPLHWPAHNNAVEIVGLLLDAGADPEADEISCYGGKPLHWASEHAPGTVELLLRRGAQVDSRNVKPGGHFEGCTPLIMNATQDNDCAEVAELLLAAGADVNAVDAQGRSALDHAVAGQRPRIEAVLLKAGGRRAAASGE